MRVFMILLLLLSFAAPVMAAEKDGRKILYWVAPMDPNYRQDKPGKSPMGMDLVPVYADEQEETGGTAQKGLKISPVYRQALGVRTAPVRMEDFGRAIEAPGSIVPETRREYAVAVRAAGWIVDLKTDAVGDTVKKGDLLFTFYSPDLMQAQSDFLIGHSVGNAEERLRQYGMDDQAIAELKKRGRFMRETPFYAPADGTVTMLNARKGAYMKEGGAILTLQDFSQVWIMAQVPVRDLQFLAQGMPATVIVDETGQSFSAAIDYIYPDTDMQSHDGMVRLVMDNADGILKTGSIVNVVFDAGKQPRLAVPEEAVLYDDGGGHVIEALGGGYFQPVAVKTGITAHGLTEILSGLKEGQSIVTSGQFMIDAESSLRGGFAHMTAEPEAKADDKDMKDMPGMDMKGTNKETDHEH